MDCIGAGEYLILYTHRVTDTTHSFSFSCRFINNQAMNSIKNLTRF